MLCGYQDALEASLNTGRVGVCVCAPTSTPQMDIKAAHTLFFQRLDEPGHRQQRLLGEGGLLGELCLPRESCGGKTREWAWKFLPAGIPASFHGCPRTGSSCCSGTATTNTSAHACPISENFSLILSPFCSKSHCWGLSRLLRCKEDPFRHMPCLQGASCPDLELLQAKTLSPPLLPWHSYVPSHTYSSWQHQVGAGGSDPPLTQTWLPATLTHLGSLVSTTGLSTGPGRTQPPPECHGFLPALGGPFSQAWVRLPMIQVPRCCCLPSLYQGHLAPDPAREE